MTHPVPGHAPGVRRPSPLSHPLREDASPPQPPGHTSQPHPKPFLPPQTDVECQLEWERAPQTQRLGVDPATRLVTRRGAALLCPIPGVHSRPFCLTLTSSSRSLLLTHSDRSCVWPPAFHLHLTLLWLASPSFAQETVGAAPPQTLEAAVLLEREAAMARRSGEALGACEVGWLPSRRFVPI